MLTGHIEWLACDRIVDLLLLPILGQLRHRSLGFFIRRTACTKLIKLTVTLVVTLIVTLIVALIRVTILTSSGPSS